MQIQPFQINVPQAVLDDLQKRLARTRWTDEVEGVGWDYGTNLDYLKELVDYWQHQYNWRKQEAELNKFAQFKAEVNGIGIHFIHERGKGPNPIPIILTHGWPDSFYRFHKIVPRLTDPVRYSGNPNNSFDVILPSMPGFGFSDRTAIAAGAVADLWAKLMTEILDYQKFAAAGGDLGTYVTKSLAAKYPEAVMAIHLTDVSYPTGMEDFSTMSKAEQDFAARTGQWWYSEGAYAMLHSTKPQTLAYSLNDSPIGLAAWMVEKFRAWSDSNGDVERRFTKDELLTHVMIYWVTETIGSSVRMYLENARATYGHTPAAKSNQRSEVPAAVASFPGDTAPLPREWAERNVNLKRFTEMPRGGHFAAWEEPELFANDLRESLGELRARN
jgi:pimeloyl-ACP methyl ester carboxylesterase